MGGSEMGIKGIMGKMCLKWSKGALRTIFLCLIQGYIIFPDLHFLPTIPFLPSNFSSTATNIFFAPHPPKKSVSHQIWAISFKTKFTFLLKLFFKKIFFGSKWQFLDFLSTKWEFHDFLSTTPEGAFGNFIFPWFYTFYIMFDTFYSTMFKIYF